MPVSSANDKPNPAVGERFRGAFHSRPGHRRPVNPVAANTRGGNSRAAPLAVYYA